MYCWEVPYNESSTLAGTSLVHHQAFWNRLRPKIKNIQVEEKRFVPWLTLSGWKPVAPKD